jgi:hypothetical protein
MILGRRNQRISRYGTTAALYAENPTWIALGLDLGLGGEKPLTV